MRESWCRLEGDIEGREKTEQALDLGAGLGPTALPMCSTTGKVLKPTGLLLDPASFSLLHLCWEPVYVAADLYL